MTYLCLARWPNLLIIALIFLLAKTQIVDPIGYASGYFSCLTNFDWFLFALATILIAASGNVVNDIFDQEIDKYNKPDKLIVGNLITEERAWNVYYALGSMGLLIGIGVSWKLGNVSNALIFMLAAGGLYFYSYSYKRQFLIGNVVVAILAGLVPFIPVYFYMMCAPNMWMQLPWSPVLVAFGFFALLTTLIREVIKDMEDLKGDQLLRCQTMPIVIGTKATKAIVVFLIAILIGVIGKLQLAWWHQNDMVMFLYTFVAIQVPAVAAMVQVLRSQSSKDFHLASTITKLLMLGGIFWMVVYNMTLE